MTQHNRAAAHVAALHLTEAVRAIAALDIGQATPDQFNTLTGLISTLDQAGKTARRLADLFAPGPPASARRDPGGRQSCPA
jgi:hypothetical protein